METKTGTVYHTGLKRGGMNTYAKHCTNYESAGNIAFQHDLTKGLHSNFLKADCFYSEPAWQAGYKVFVEKSGVSDSGDFADYLESIVSTIREAKKPAYILMGKAMVKRLRPDYTFPIVIAEHGCEAVVGCYNGYNQEIASAKTNTEVMQAICREYNVICDFSCGFGNVIPFVLEHGKHFVVSDICADCIGYIAERYMGAEL